MFKFKFFLSITIFLILLITTSVIKNKSREIEKKIYTLNKTLLLKERDYNESQLDFFYLTSPTNIEKKIVHLDNNDYLPMKYSQIFLSMSSFLDLKNKFAVQENYNDKKKKK